MTQNQRSTQERAPDNRAIRRAPAHLLRELVEIALGEFASPVLAGLDQREARSINPLVITKSQRRSSVHRPGYLDQISVKIFGRTGTPVGVRRFVGLYTSTVYNEDPLDIPLVRLKVNEVMRESGLDPRSHRGKALQHILNTFPRDDLFQISIADLARIGTGILDLQER